MRRLFREEILAKFTYKSLKKILLIPSFYTFFENDLFKMFIGVIELTNLKIKVIWLASLQLPFHY